VQDQCRGGASASWDSKGSSPQVKRVHVGPAEGDPPPPTTEALRRWPPRRTGGDVFDPVFSSGWSHQGDSRSNILCEVEARDVNPGREVTELLRALVASPGSPKGRLDQPDRRCRPNRGAAACWQRIATARLKRLTEGEATLARCLRATTIRSRRSDAGPCVSGLSAETRAPPADDGVGMASGPVPPLLLAMLGFEWRTSRLSAAYGSESRLVLASRA
jgi:hypothetical protein